MATTIVAVRYGGTGPRSGVVVGADTRTSSGGYVSNRFAAKLTLVLDRDADEVASDGSVGGNNSDDGGDGGGQQEEASTYSTCCVCRSGSAADTQALADAVRTDLLHRHLSHNRKGTVTAAARLLQNMIRNDAGADHRLSASLICAGYDHVRGRSCIYSISPGGAAVEELVYAVQGSGSGYIYGYLEAGIYAGGDGGGGGASKGKEDGSKISTGTEGWTQDDAVDFVTRVVGLAVERDGSSGGFCRILAIDREGKKEYTRVLHRHR
jgi:20S proteasome subunit beta 1